MDAPRSDAIEQVRQFNRTVTQRIGALHDHFMSRDRALGEARLLWEIGADGADVKALRTRLDLDSGYTSRLLRALERAELVIVAPDDRDRRARTVRLTDSGHAEWAILDRRSDQLAQSMLEPLDATQRVRLLDAMRTVERLLTAGRARITVTDPTSPDGRHCLEAYVAELDARFDSGFDANRSISADASELTEPAGLLLVARLHGRAVGCGALKFHADRPAEIKRMWIDPSVRGLGLGRRLLTELEQHARDHNVDIVRLETNRSLTEAISLYRTAGYTEVAPFNEEPYAHHWFEKRLSDD